MTRYLVNATVEVDGYAYVDADSLEAAYAEAEELNSGDFELADRVGVLIDVIVEDV